MEDSLEEKLRVKNQKIPFVTILPIPVMDFIVRMLKTFLAVIFALAVFAVGIWLGVRFTAKSGSGIHEEQTDSVVEQIQTLSDLVTVKYVVEKVVILDDAKWYGESRVLLLAHGVVKAGIDLKRIKADDVQVSGKSIAIRLPPPELTDAYLDDRRSQVIDHTTGLLRTFDKDLEQTAREEAVLDIRSAAVQNGILEDATQRAELELALFLHEAGYQQVKFNGGKPFNLQNEVSHF
ncbi:MAG TPA: DUF4230 domain-containing protein [Verrucomicrobiae bacterium]|nr:DUF4230 domain-containing protein [Verrucomicrobiae bacterium]